MRTTEMRGGESGFGVVCNALNVITALKGRAAADARRELGRDLRDLGRDDVEYHFMLDMDGVYGGMPDVAEAASKGELTVEIGEVFPFNQAVDAVVAYAREKLPGKIVVTF